MACESASPAAEEGLATSGTEGGDTTSDTGADSDGASCVPELADDCMDPGLKCMPWAEAMGPPTDHQCCPLDSDPIEPGERCQIQDYVHSCIDDCPAGSMCMLDDIDALAGYCHEFCDITDSGACGVDAVCMPLFKSTDAVTPLCLLRCDPLLQDCEGRGRVGWACIPNSPFSPEFLCLPPTVPVPKVAYEECKIPSDCAAGLTCAPASQMLGCESGSCCTPLCDANAEPSLCTMGNACIALESEVPGLENVGVCLDPAA